jgi:hypothetical protein
VTVQEAQGLLIELGYALVDGSVRAGLEHQKFVRLDSICQRVGEAQRGHKVVAAECDLGRGRDTAELGDCIMGDHRVRLAYEGVERLFRPTAHESGELVDIVRLARIKLRRENTRGRCPG